MVETTSLLHAQQKEKHDQRKTKVDHRIASIGQPRVRPIMRGKAHANTEFGEKLHLCIEYGLSRVDYAPFEACTEASRLIDAAESYKMRNGSYPKRILADKLYLNRANRTWRKAHDIELPGPNLEGPGSSAREPQARAQSRQRSQLRRGRIRYDEALVWHGSRDDEVEGNDKDCCCNGGAVL